MDNKKIEEAVAAFRNRHTAWQEFKRWDKKIGPLVRELTSDEMAEYVEQTKGIYSDD